MGNGLKMIMKTYGGMTFTDSHGKKETWLWDYDKDCPVRESDMIADKKAHAASERAKWLRVKADREKVKQGELF